MAVKEHEFTKSGLVLDSLEVKNFRAFKHLTIEKLGRVNLITGKNSVGKTTLLEALFFYAHGGYPIWIRIFLGLRNELALGSQSPSRLDQRQFKFNLDDLNELRNIRHLFNGRVSIDNPLDAITIGDLHGLSEKVTVGLDWFVDDKGSDVGGVRGLRLTPVSHMQRLEYPDAQPYITVGIEDYFLARYRLDQVMRAETNTWDVPRALPCEFLLPSSSTDSETARQWDAIASSDLEDEVISAIRIIHPGIESIRYIADPKNDKGRVAVVRINGDSERVTLRTLGDGINHLLSIALSLVNTKDGVCLLDEIETGIHYSVVPDLWKFIFRLARSLNVQVFATTHSWECIEAFQEVADADDDPSSGVLVRLQNKDGNITSTVFDERRLGIVTRQGIEVR